MALPYGILNKRIPWAKIEEIVFVDARRPDKQRRLFHFSGLRRVLDQLN
jgi:hypothetical protein